MASSDRRRLRRSTPPSTKARFPRVAEALRSLRQQADLSQERFAALIGLSYAGYRPYERGSRDLTGAQIEAFAKALGVPVSEITTRLWPDETALIETHYSYELAELQRQIEPLPEEQRARILRHWRTAVEIACGSNDLARRN